LGEVGVDDALKQGILAVDAASAFNAAQGFEIAALADGQATIKMTASATALNHSKALHAGIVAGLLDTVAGYAAATVAGQVVTVGLNIAYVSASSGPTFEARADVIRAGRTQVFVDARLFAIGETEKLIATANVILTRI
jgi:uncharacterized protein (TIGR00369 family)